MTKSLRQYLCGMAFACLLVSSGCAEKNLGSPDNPEKFTQEVRNEFDAQIEEVNADESLSESEKEKRIKQIEQEREDFEKYNADDGQGE